MNTKSKIDLIKIINQILMTDSGKIITSNDFDILYDLDIDELINVKRELIRQVKPQQHSNSKGS